MASTLDEDPESGPGLSRRALLALASVGVSSIAIANVLGDARAANASPVWVGGWNSPLNSASPGINSPFLEGGFGHGYYDGENYHLGLDLTAASNEPVYSIGSGTVLEVQTGNYPGQALFVKHTAHDGTEFQAVYGHINASVSGSVAAGQQIGTVFAQDAHHLHFGVRTVLSSYPRWGARDLDLWPSTDGFVEPREFLNAHPQATNVPMRSPVSYDLIPSGSNPELHWLVNTDYLNANGTPIKVALYGGDWGLMVAAKNNTRALTTEEANQYFGLISMILPRAASQITP